MALCWPSLILLLYALLTSANATTNYTLSAELTNVIPTCARKCFISFLISNFPSGTCSTKPTLDFLCSRNSTSGYTVGEGAVQCIISEINIGFCKGDSARDFVVQRAYGMCSGEPSALPNTHATITATLVIQTSMPSIVLVAPAPTKFSSLSSRRSSIVMSAGITKTTRVTPSSTYPAASSSQSPSSSVHPSTLSSLPVASEISSPEPILTKNQIIGITVASVCGAGVAVGLLVVFICRRRRRKKRVRESDLIPFQLEPNYLVMDTNKHKYKSFKGPSERIPGGTRNGVAAKIPPRIPLRLDTSSPNMFSRSENIRHNTVGLAISPEQEISPVKQQRRSSKLLPEKPALTLQVPQQAKASNGFTSKQPTVQPSAISRQSTATQFEEDGDDGADTVVAADASWTANSPNQVLDTRTGNWQTIRIVDPEPSNIAPGEVYAWRPGQASNSTATDPGYHIRPLCVNGRRIGSFSQPRALIANVRQEQQSLPFSKHDGRPITDSSSFYSSRGSVSSAEEGSCNDGPKPLENRYSSQQNNPFDQEPILPRDQKKGSRVLGMELALSPVVESPASGRSPVSYPKIPPLGGSRRLSQNTIRMIPPPPQPDFTKGLSAGKLSLHAEIAAKTERERERVVGAQQSQVQGQVSMQGIQSAHQRQRSRELREVATAHPLVSFTPDPPLALVPGNSKMISPPATPSPYIFRSASQSKLVPPPLLRAHSRSQLTREVRTRPPQYLSPVPQTQLQNIVELPLQKPTHLPLLSSPSQLQHESRALSPSQLQVYNQQPHKYSQQQLTSANSPLLNLLPPSLLRSPSQTVCKARTLPSLQTSQPSQPPTSNDEQTQSATSVYPLTSSQQAQAPQTCTTRPHINPLSAHPSITSSRSSSLVSQHSTSTTSSLLHKRLGSQRASALTPTLTLKNEEDRKKQMARWRVLNKRERVEAKKEGLRRMQRREGDEEGWSAWGGGMYEFERVELPITPGWVPKLTPTRRGDELFLSVQ
ncbi:hypothetical protein QTJ16_005198 [Diplocarpon rosae]|uniref:Uncharacterized protein n=1 Tax=Diplocarpon rosae TaxID=946125 RepID=A0AAD9SYF2_9HELO|nr:hypothetical protein QTJ16_005198 [Diplocarpon rosae]